MGGFKLGMMGAGQDDQQSCEGAMDRTAEKWAWNGVAERVHKVIATGPGQGHL